MTYKHLLILIAFIYLQADVIGQRDTIPRLSLSLGPAHLSRQDLIFSPFRHNDLSLLSFGLHYEKNKAVHQFARLDYAGFEAGLVTPYDILLDDSVATAYPHTFTLVGLHYGLGKWFGKNTRFQSLAGGSFDVDIQAANYNYGIFGFFGYYATIGAGIWYKGIYQISERHRLSGEIHLPLVSWYARSPYLVNDDEFIENIYSHNGFKTFFAYLGDGELASWNTLQTLNAGLEYRYALSPKWSAGASWKFSYVHATDPLPITSILQQYHLVIGLSL